MENAAAITLFRVECFFYIVIHVNLFSWQIEKLSIVPSEFKVLASSRKNSETK